MLELDEETAGFDLLPRRISQADIIYVTSQLAIMVDTGITLSTALDSIAEQEAEPHAQGACCIDLQDARRRRARIFPRPWPAIRSTSTRRIVSLIKASEQTGTLGEMLDTVADYLRSQLETRQRCGRRWPIPASWPCWPSA